MTESEYVSRVIREYVIACDEEVHWTRNGGDLRAFVNCNDFFYWATADGEEIEPEDIDDLIALSKKYSKHDPANPQGTSYQGELLWCCKKRNLRPLYQVMDEWEAKYPDLFAELCESTPPRERGAGQ